MARQKTAWDKLSMNERAQYLKLGFQHGLRNLKDVRDTYDLYASGGKLAHKYDGNTEATSQIETTVTPTKEQYITQKLDSVRNSALEKSRNKTQDQTTIVYEGDVYGNKQLISILQERYNNAASWFNYILDASYENYKRNNPILSEKYTRLDLIENYPDFQYYLKYINDAQKLLEAAKNGECKGQEVSNCIANLSEMFPHGLPYGNQSFQANPTKYGFSLIDTQDVKPGDLIQYVEHGVPIHAMMYNGVDKNGKPTFNYSNGLSPYMEDGVLKGGYGTNKHYPDVVSKDGKHLENANVYRYTGTPQDSIQWSNEWEQQYGTQKALGGTLSHKKSGEAQVETSWLNNGYNSSEDWQLQMKLNADQMVQNIQTSPFYMTNQELQNLELSRMKEAAQNNPNSEFVTYSWVDENGNQMIKRIPNVTGLNTMWDIGAVDYLPFIGDFKQGVDALGAATQGDYMTAGLLGSLLLVPNVLEKPLKIGMNAIKHSFKNTANRAFETALRVGDLFAAHPVESMTRQLFRNNAAGLKYIFKGDSNLAYQLPFKYSGMAIPSYPNNIGFSVIKGAEAHYGDLIDVLLGKSDKLLDTHGNVLAEFTTDLTNVPNKTIAAFKSLPGKSNVTPRVLRFNTPTYNPVTLDDAKFVDIFKATPNNIPFELHRTQGEFNTLLNGVSTPQIDPGHYGVTAIKRQNGIDLYGHDVYHFTPKQYSKTHRSNVPGLNFTIGEPFIAEWPLSVVNYNYKGTDFIPSYQNFQNKAQTLYSTGGPLYPFSFEKNPFLKTPAVRYDNGGQTYTVKSGDYLGKIAGIYGLTVSDIVSANPGLNPDKINVGQVLKIPNVNKTPSKEAIVSAAWQNENPNNVGYKNGLYYSYKDPNDRGMNVGPGLLVGVAIPEKESYTKEELDAAAYTYGLNSLNAIGQAFNEKYGTTELATPFDTVSIAPKLLALDTRYQNGSLPVSGWPSFYQALAEGNWAEALKQSRSTYIDAKGVKHYDNDRVRRRAEALFPNMFNVTFKPDSKELPVVTKK